MMQELQKLCKLELAPLLKARQIQAILGILAQIFLALLAKRYESERCFRFQPEIYRFQPEMWWTEWKCRKCPGSRSARVSNFVKRVRLSEFLDLRKINENKKSWRTWSQNEFTFETSGETSTMETSEACTLPFGACTSNFATVKASYLKSPKIPKPSQFQCFLLFSGADMCLSMTTEILFYVSRSKLTCMTFSKCCQRISWSRIKN